MILSFLGLILNCRRQGHRRAKCLGVLSFFLEVFHLSLPLSAFGLGFFLLSFSAVLFPFFFFALTQSWSCLCCLAKMVDLVHELAGHLKCGICYNWIETAMVTHSHTYPSIHACCRSVFCRYLVAFSFRVPPFCRFVLLLSLSLFSLTIPDDRTLQSQLLQFMY